MLADDEYVDDGEPCPMEIDVEPNLYDDDLSDLSDESETTSNPDSPKPAVLKRSAEFFQRVESDSGSTDSTEHVPSTSPKDDTKSSEAETGRKKLKKALSGKQGSLISVDTVEVFTVKM